MNFQHLALKRSHVQSKAFLLHKQSRWKADAVSSISNASQCLISVFNAFSWAVVWFAVQRLIGWSRGPHHGCFSDCQYSRLRGQLLWLLRGACDKNIFLSESVLRRLHDMCPWFAVHRTSCQHGAHYNYLQYFRR